MKRRRRQVARDARNGRFISLRRARRKPATSVIETISYPRRRRPVVRVLTEENQNGFGSPYA